MDLHLSTYLLSIAWGAPAAGWPSRCYAKRQIKKKNSQECESKEENEGKPKGPYGLGSVSGKGLSTPGLPNISRPDTGERAQTVAIWPARNADIVPSFSFLFHFNLTRFGTRWCRTEFGGDLAQNEIPRSISLINIIRLKPIFSFVRYYSTWKGYLPTLEDGLVDVRYGPNSDKFTGFHRVFMDSTSFFRGGGG